MAETRIGLIGYGKIAEDQHVPAIAGNPDFTLAAVASRHAHPDLGVPIFHDAAEMLRGVELDAVAICTPPGPRHAITRFCLESGLHVMMEKPPCLTLGEVADLAACAKTEGRSLFATWHSRFNDTVERAAAITRAEGIATMDIQWLEDVDKWHPGQDWIWERGGFGVFDPGINALSIATLLCPEPLLVRKSDLRMEKRGHQPEGVVLQLATGGVEQGIGARFEWRYRGTEQWTIDLTTKVGTRLALSKGGAVLRVDDGPEQLASSGEYPGLYARFAELIATGESEVDVEPLRVVADALLAGEKVSA
ncbi:MAG: Gfo/Idh/MocA family oxidoreductase [Sphingomonas sp.]|nr:Gfo/Idh/MocA family oxidoreductase [Sphingomonas sp.]